MSPPLEIEGLNKSYHGVRILRDVSFSLREGEFFGFAGINGAGKSTLLKCLLDFCHYESGQIRIFGESSRHPRARARVAFLPERFIPPYYLTGGEFLRMMAALRGIEYSRAGAEEMLEKLDLDRAALNKPVRSYSKGMTQKLGLVSCFLSRQDFYVLDEPMSGLDPKARALVKRRFRELREAGATLFFTSHMLADIEEICETVSVLHGGKICYSGSPSDMREKYGGAGTLEDAYLQIIGEHPEMSGADAAQEAQE